MDKDVILGTVDNYDWNKIKYWANSIKQSGFKGHKALIVFNMDDSTVKKLTEEQFMLIGVTPYEEGKGFKYDSKGRSIMVDRFFYIYNFLRMLDDSFDRIIVTDVRDVVFQSNPTDWINEYFLPQYNLIVGSENLKYEDEPWGRNNIKKSFGDYFYDMLKDQQIICAGVLAGTLNDIRDLCLNIYLITHRMNPHIEGGGGPDQAALNIILDMIVHRYTTLYTDPLSGWVVHAGTSMPAIKSGSGGIGEAYMKNPNMKLPFIKDVEYRNENGKIYSFNKLITVLHQWDRVPEWKKLVEEQYGD